MTNPDHLEFLAHYLNNNNYNDGINKPLRQKQDRKMSTASVKSTGRRKSKTVNEERTETVYKMTPPMPPPMPPPVPPPMQPLILKSEKTQVTEAVVNILTLFLKIKLHY